MYTSFNYPIKRIIGGRTFNTEVSTEIAGFDSHDEHFGYSNKTALFKTRKGAYFLGSFQEYHEDEPLSIIPLTPERAKIWLERNFPTRPEIIETEFGEQPEAEAEVRFTLRMTDTLKKRINSLAKIQHQSINQFVIDCVENSLEAHETAAQEEENGR